MKTRQIDNQYSTGLTIPNIERALMTAGTDLDQLQPSDLAGLEDFHTLGRVATSQLAELAEITGADEVLDAAAGSAERHAFWPSTTAATSPPST